MLHSQSKSPKSQDFQILHNSSKFKLRRSPVGPKIKLSMLSVGAKGEPPQTQAAHHDVSDKGPETPKGPAAPRTKLSFPSVGPKREPPKTQLTHEDGPLHDDDDDGDDDEMMQGPAPNDDSKTSLDDEVSMQAGDDDGAAWTAAIFEGSAPRVKTPSKGRLIPGRWPADVKQVRTGGRGARMAPHRHALTSKWAPCR